MARFNEVYYSGIDSYSDGDIEEDILNIVKSGKKLSELNREEVSFPIVYHLSDIRKNIFVWYPFIQNAHILEVGAGCGAITGVLCEKAASVTAVELSKRRATINYERNRSYDNLEIVVGNLNDIEFEKKFDYIILNGVFEYAASFTDSDRPYEKFLSSIAQKLTDDGKILIAIENRLGAKYFAGAPEDHVDLYFSGLNKYEGIHSVKTFSKGELIELCSNIKLVCNKFYYPYPDYKFPYEIFTDKTINTSLYGRPMFQFSDKRINFIDEKKLNDTFVKEKVADKFANSFLVEVTKKKIESEEEIEYVKINTDRVNKFKIYTTIWSKDGEKYVSKYPVGKDAEQHIDKMLLKKEVLGVWHNLEGKKGQDREAVYPFLTEKTLDETMVSCISHYDEEGCVQIFESVRKAFLADSVEMNAYGTEEFTKIFGDECIPVPLHCKKDMNIDLILDNIFVQENEFVLIDTEWEFPFYIPTEYVMWRILNECYYKHPALDQLLTRDNMLEKYGITHEMESVFRSWEHNFANVYVGSYELQHYAKDIIPIDMKQATDSVLKKHIVESSLYIDLGNGYSESNIIKSAVELNDGRFHIIYKFSDTKSIQKLRWDPVESPCACFVMQAKTNKGLLEVSSLNKVYSDGAFDVFMTFDPCYELRGDLEGVTEIIIDGELNCLSMNEFGLVADKNNRIYTTEIQQLKNYISWVQTSRLWVLYRGKEYIKSKLRLLKRKYKNLKLKVKSKLEKRAEIKKSNIAEVLTRVIEKDKEQFTCDEVIDVIIPIYNGYDYLVKLFPTLTKTNMKCRYFLVDDKSSDERVREIEHEFVNNHENAVLLENPENYGFVKSVNNALKQCVNHVALVNTDTELPEKWLERLMKPILTEEKIGSTTPYSNSATIFSFPNFCYNNEIYRHLSVDKIDEQFGKIKPKYVKTPTGVGFCMGMNKHAIKEIGTLDYETFSKGFGEENDWCQRAELAGYRNVQVENLFVYHKHGGSFLSEEKAALLEHNVAIVNKRYPNYEGDVRKFIRADANKEIRNVVQMLLDMQIPEKKSILAFDHSLGGGATEYLENKAKTLVEEGNAVTVIRYDLGQNKFRFLFRSLKFEKEYELNSMEELLQAASHLHYDEIYVNEIVTYPFIAHTLDLIEQIALQQNAKLVMLFHDYFAICPSINLVGTQNVYCGFPEKSACLECFRQKQCHTVYKYNNVEEWQVVWNAFLHKCDEVRTFSQDTLDRVRQVYGTDLKLTIVPHKVEYLFPLNKEHKTTDHLVIGLLGVMTLHKGKKMVETMLQEMERRNIDAEVVLIGYVEDESLIKYKHFRQTGRYQTEDLPGLIYKNDIDIFLIPSVWPETFSYTAEEIMQMQMPVACFDIGAPASRIRMYDKGVIISEMNGICALDTILQYAQTNHFMERKNRDEKKVIFIAEYLSFSSRYRVEHMQEELLCQGIDSELWTTDALPQEVPWNQIAKIVIYRCRDMEPLSKFMKLAKEHHIELLYDIDDFIFNYDRIANLPFMKSEEYKDFATYTAMIKACMEKCNRFITSTDTLKEAIKQDFPKQDVFVNRNMASTKMQILSAKARLAKASNHEDVVLGYFSGSNTHNGDFDIIAGVLLEVMKQRTNVKMKIVGCLELGEEFEPYEDRIEKVGFMDWKKLPEVIASIDINLMPLENTMFHACKSENKWMEAAFVQVPTIASLNREMSLHTSDGEDILLCQSSEEWLQKLLQLIDDKGMRENIAEKAWKRVRAEKSTIEGKEELYHYVMD